MAESRETTILEVNLDAGKVANDLSDVIAKITELKKQQADLNSKIKAGNDVNGENSKKLMDVRDQLSWCEKKAKGLSAATKLINEDSKTYADTLNGQRQKLADLQKAYGELTAEQRNSEGGQAFLKSIDAQSEAVKELEAAMGDHRRNVGNYPKELTAVVPGLNTVTSKMDAMQQTIEGLGKVTPGTFKSMASGIGQATKAALKFIATPIGAILAAIAVAVKALQAVFSKLSEAFKKNDEAGTNLARLMSSFQPIITMVNKVFDGLAQVLGKVAGWLADIISKFSDESKAAQDLVTNIDDLEETERQYTVNSAKRNKEIAQLRAEAAESTDLATRKQKLQEAIELEKQNLADEKAIAEQRLKNLEETAKQNVDTSDETANAIAQARAAQYQAEEKYYTGVRRLNKELQSIGTQEVAEANARAKEMTEIEKERAENELEIRRMAEDFAVSLIEDEGERKIEAYRIAGEREIEALQRRLETEQNLTAEAREQLSQLIADKDRELNEKVQEMKDEQALEDAEKERERALYIAEQRQEALNERQSVQDELTAEDEEARWQAQKEVWQLQMEDELSNIDLTNEQKLALQEKWNAVLEAAEQDHQRTLTDIQKAANKERQKNQMATAQASADFMGQLSDILADYGEDSKEAAIASKVLALGKIAVETGVAIASGVAQAQSVPFPANIAAIVTTITAVMTNIASAISTVKSAKFATGGVVGGGAYGQGDTVKALLSPQEVVLNPTQTANTLFAIANGANYGGVSAGELVEVVTEAVAAQPAPVMDYSEFTDFQKNVATYNELAKI